MDLIRPCLDLTRYAWRHTHGDVEVFGSWQFDPDDGPVPCMVLVPAHRALHASFKPCVVSLDLAWIWSEEQGNPEFAAEVAAEFAEALGIGFSVRNAIRIAGIIRDHLGDLLSIPPRPRTEDYEKVVADVLATNADGKERHAEIREPV